MKKSLLILCLAVTATFRAQTHRYIYELTRNLGGEKVKTDMALDIDKNNVHFYDYEFIKTDSMSLKTGENWMHNTETDQLVSRKLNSTKNREYHDYQFEYLSIDTDDPVSWKILPETRIFGENHLQKAETDFGGRHWMAWFSTDVPFHEGPYKFQGLPGLIFELWDSEELFHYILVKNKNFPATFDTSHFLETHYGKKPIPVTRKKYHEMMLNDYNDPAAFSKDVIKKGGTVIMNNEKITTLEQLDRQKPELQRRLRKYYLPVEKTTAIPYPSQ